MTDFTLSGDERLVGEAEAYARAHNTTVDQLVRGFLEQLARPLTPAEAADRFTALAQTAAGRSEAGFVFDRSAVYERGKWQ